MSLLSWMKKSKTEEELDESKENTPLLDTSQNKRKRKAAQPFGVVTNSEDISEDEGISAAVDEEKPSQEKDSGSDDEKGGTAAELVISDDDDDDDSFIAPTKHLIEEDSDDSMDEHPKKKTSKTARGRGRGTPAGSTRGGVTPRGRGTPRGGRGGGRGGRASGGGNDFNTEASKKKFYKKLSGLDKPALINMVRGGE